MPSAASARAWQPTLAVLAVALAAGALGRGAPLAVANVGMVVFGITLVLGPSIVYPLVRRTGLPAAGATAWALVLPLIWVAKECIATARVHGAAAGLFYAGNPVAVGLLVGAACQASAWELGLRRVAEGRWRFANPAGGVLVTVLVMGALIGFLTHADGGRAVFYWYMALYRHLFRE